MVIALSVATIIFRLDKTFRNTPLFVQENNGKYALYETSKFINEKKLNGLIWDSYGHSLNYYVKNSESKIIYDYHLEIFQFFQKNYSGDDLTEKFKSINVMYFIFKESNIDYLLRLTKSSRDVSPRSSVFFQNNLINYLDFRDKYLTEIFRSGDIAVYAFRDEAEQAKKNSSD